MQEGRTGWIVEPSDPEGPSACLQEALTDPVRLARLGTAGHAWYRKQRDEEGEQLLQVYARLTASPWEERHGRTRDVQSDTLGASLALAAVEQPMVTLMVTSAGPSEGKSLTAANLGIALAGMGKRVLLIDCDLRRPTQQRVFGLANTDGLSTAIAHPEQDVTSLVQETAVDRLSVLTSGRLPPNPVQYVASPHLSAVFESLRATADILIIDSSPPLLVADAAILWRPRWMRCRSSPTSTARAAGCSCASTCNSVASRPT